ncbi:unnamed protein product, partial [Pleuronectes platessa]
ISIKLLIEVKGPSRRNPTATPPKRGWFFASLPNTQVSNRSCALIWAQAIPEGKVKWPSVFSSWLLTSSVFWCWTGAELGTLRRGEAKQTAVQTPQIITQKSHWERWVGSGCDSVGAPMFIDIHLHMS